MMIAAFVALSPSGQAAYQATITADCNGNTGSIDKAKLLNVARGGQGINSDLTWMPSFYDKLVEIGVREFRIDWLLGDNFYSVVSRNGSGQLVYNFTKLDQIIIPLAQRGIKPIMCMTQMASALGPATGVPNNYEEYKATIRAYVLHYMELGYSGWEWESHNEPETHITAAQSYQMYKSFAQAVREVDATAKVGGYGAVGSDWGAYMNSFFDLYKADLNAGTAPPMDYFSTHQYGGDNFSQITYAENQFFSRGLTPPGIYLTEWNNSFGSGTLEGNAGSTGGGYDNTTNAAYVAMKLNSANSYYWLRRACFFNFADTNSGQAFSGDLGLFTVDGHRKSVANVFWMYNRLGSNTVPITATGAGTDTKRVYACATRDFASGNISVILWNFQTTGVELSLALNNLPFASLGKNIRLTRHLIDSTHGNYYYDHLNGHTGSAPGPNENAALVESSTLLPAASLTRGEYLPPLSVIQITLEPTTGPVIGGKLTGTPFGASPFYGNNPQYGYDKVFDGDTTTFYNYVNASGGYVGISLAAPQIVTRARFFARPGFNRMVGGKFQGSNTSATAGFTDLYTIQSQPPAGWNEVALPTGQYRYLRYLGPANSSGEIAELEFYGTDTVAPAITPFTVAVYENTRIGSVIGTVGMSDTDLYQIPLTSHITGGNVGGAFSIEPATGKITLAAPLNATSQPWYDLQIMVSDNFSGNPLTSTATVRINVLPNPTNHQPGTISYHLFDGITGNTVADLTGNARWPVDPNIITGLPTFEGHLNRADNFGATLRGYLIPPVSGAYTFWIAGDDKAELWLSGSDSPAGIGLLAQVPDWTNPRQWTKYAQQQSTARMLTARQAYYIEARMKESSGGDHIAVAWNGPASSNQTQVVPGIYLAPYAGNNPPRVSGFTGTVRQGAVVGTRIGTANAYDANKGDSVSFSISNGNAAGLFQIDTGGVLRVANEAALLTSTPGSYLLEITATDSGTPLLSAIVSATVNVVAGTAILPGLRREIWRDIPSESLTLLTNSDKYPDLPDALETMSGFSVATNIGDNHGSRIRAYLTPTQSGSYVFNIASNNNSSLLLSTNDSPANATQIASVSGWTGVNAWTMQASQTSVARSLVAGQRYYIEALHKDATGDDHVSVGWSGPGITGTSVIAASFLTPYDINTPPINRSESFQVLRSSANGTTVGNVQATTPTHDPVTFKITAGNTGNTFAIHPDTGVISIADNTRLVNGSWTTGVLTVTIQDSGCGGLYPIRSSTSAVTIKALTGPAADLRAWLKFDEASGTSAADSSGSGNNGSLLSGAGYTTGQLGNAMNLDGTNDYAQLPNSVVSGLRDFTITVWLKLDASPTWSRVFDFGDGTTRYMFLTPKSGGGTLRFGITTSGSAGQQQINAPALPLNIWKHVAVSLSGTVGTLYVDGVPVAFNPSITLSPADLGITTNSYLGKSQFADPYLDGKLDDFRIYNRALGTTEIAALATLVPAAPTSLTVAADSSGRVDLAWTDNANSETEFLIERKTGAGGTYARIASTGADSTGFSDTGLAVGTRYFYRIATGNAGGKSPYTNEADTTTFSLLQDWRMLQFGTTADAGTAANDADPDRDGVSNLIEYSLGMNPMTAAQTGLPIPQITNIPAPGITLTYRRNRTDVTYRVERSTDLSSSGSWTTAGVDQGVPGPDGTTTAFVPKDLPAGFLRIRCSVD